MAVIDKVLIELQNNNKYISGQEMAEKFSVSRAAVWKAIKSLQDQGYNIEAITNKGYKLIEDADLLKEVTIRENLSNELEDISFYIYDSIDSTNTQAKRLLIEEKLNNFTIFLAEEQTKGRGRLGKSFLSPGKKGIYLTVVITKSLNNDEKFDLATIKAALSVTRAIEKLTNKELKIKWVNDIFFKGKKVGGILTEAERDYESGKISAIIIGMGINIKTQDSDFTPELKNIAGSLHEEKVGRNIIIAEIINNLYNIMKIDNREEIINEYKSKSNVLGKNVEFSEGGRFYTGRAIDINEDGNLIVSCNGVEKVLISGEISIKGDWYN